MSNLQYMDAVTTTTAVTLTTTTEAVAVSSNGFSTNIENVRWFMIGFAQVTTGAGTTKVTGRIRRGNAIAGTLVGAANAVDIQGTAGDISFYIMATEESPGLVAGQQYSLTIQQTAATANGTVQQATLLTMAFS